VSDSTEAKPTVATASKDYEGIDYAEFWAGPEKAHIDRLEQRLVSRFLPGGQIFAEIGSGFGRLAPCYLDRYATAHMVEPASNLRQLAEKNFTTAVHVDADVYDLPFDDATLDGLLMVRVMHHLTEPRKALSELHRVLRPGGVMFFSYSNKRNLPRVVKCLATREGHPFTGDVERYGKALWGHHPRYMEGLVTDVGFRIERRVGVGLTGKLVGLLPLLRPISQPPLFLPGLAGRLELSPTQFLLVRRQ
jgi:SAM-dependent methyltransferase